MAVSDVMAELKRTIRTEANLVLQDAQFLGFEEAARQLSFYGIKTVPTLLSVDRQAREQVLSAISARLDAQEAVIRAMVMTEAELTQIVGSEDRAGTLRSSDIAPGLAAWAASLLWSAFSTWTNNNSQGFQFKKQAVAVLDARTTDCCLRVHAQIQPLNKPFHLTGTPRFSDYMEWPGFHNWCRTAGVLYLDAYDDGLTADMRTGADRFLVEREQGGRPDRNPADALG
jgi:hypothetical protein